MGELIPLPERERAFGTMAIFSCFDPIRAFAFDGIPPTPPVLILSSVAALDFLGGAGAGGDPAAADRAAKVPGSGEPYG